MTDLYRKPFSLVVELEIEAEQKKIHEEYWPKLDEFTIREPTAALRAGNSLIAPPVREPARLASVLRSYASALFNVAANKYPDDPQLNTWISDLLDEVYDVVMDRLWEAVGLEEALPCNFKERRKELIDATIYHASY